MPIYKEDDPNKAGHRIFFTISEITVLRVLVGTANNLTLNIKSSDPENTDAEYYLYAAQEVENKLAKAIGMKPRDMNTKLEPENKHELYIKE